MLSLYGHSTSFLEHGHMVCSNAAKVKEPLSSFLSTGTGLWTEFIHIRSKSLLSFAPSATWPLSRKPSRQPGSPSPKRGKRVCLVISCHVVTHLQYLPLAKPLFSVHCPCVFTLFLQTSFACSKRSVSIFSPSHSRRSLCFKDSMDGSGSPEFCRVMNSQ